MTAPAFRRLFEPLTIGNFTVRNRIVNATHGTGLSDERDLRYLQERALGGAGLLGVHASAGIYGYPREGTVTLSRSYRPVTSVYQALDTEAGGITEAPRSAANLWP